MFACHKYPFRSPKAHELRRTHQLPLLQNFHYTLKQLRFVVFFFGFEHFFCPSGGDSLHSDYFHAHVTKQAFRVRRLMNVARATAYIHTNSDMYICHMSYAICTYKWINVQGHVAVRFCDFCVDSVFRITSALPKIAEINTKQVRKGYVRM